MERPTTIIPCFYTHHCTSILDCKTHRSVDTSVETFLRLHPAVKREIKAKVQRELGVKGLEGGYIAGGTAGAAASLGVKLGGTAGGVSAGPPGAVAGALAGVVVGLSAYFITKAALKDKYKSQEIAKLYNDPYFISWAKKVEDDAENTFIVESIKSLDDAITRLAWAMSRRLLQGKPNPYYREVTAINEMFDELCSPDSVQSRRGHIPIGKKSVKSEERNYNLWDCLFMHDAYRVRHRFLGTWMSATTRAFTYEELVQIYLIRNRLSIMEREWLHKAIKICQEQFSKGPDRMDYDVKVLVNALADIRFSIQQPSYYITIGTIMLFAPSALEI